MYLIVNDDGDCMFAVEMLASLTAEEAAKYRAIPIDFYGDATYSEGQLLFNNAEKPVALITHGVSALDIGIRKNAAFTRYITIKQGNPYADR